MGKIIRIVMMIAFFSINAGADEKIEFGICGTDIKTHCSASQGEHAKHDCLSKLDVSNLSQACLEYRKKMLTNKNGVKNNEHKGHKHK